MNARRHVGQDPVTATTAPTGASGNGEHAKSPLPTRVPAKWPRRGNRDLSGRSAGAPAPVGQAVGGPSSVGPTASGPGAPWLLGYGSDGAEQAHRLSTRLMALSRMIQIGSARSGRDGFSQKLLDQADDVIGRAGERMQLSSAHTVVVLAGGTGSGKSSLFNCLAGADFSTVGVTRPITKDAHACIWDSNGSGALLEWLGVPQRNRYSRASALGGGESGLAGLVLLDLPDHDSVVGGAVSQVDRLVSLADVMIWVLDPQKYADVPLSGHSEVQAIVLNQADLLTAAQIDDCAADLRRLLDSEDLPDVPILVTSAVTGAGLDELRTLLADGVLAKRAAAARISADVDTVVDRFAAYAGELPSGHPNAAPSGREPAAYTDRLVDQFYAAAGVTAVGDSLRSARELRAADFVGWPIGWLVQRLTGRDPLRKVRLTGPVGAQQAAIDNSLDDFGDQLAEPLPKPWSHTVKAAARSRADAIPAAVGTAIGEALPAEDSVEGWWRLAGLWQGILLGLVVIALAWLIAVVVFGVFHVANGLPRLLTHPLSIAWAALTGVVALGAGASTASVCMALVRKRSAAENARIDAEIRKRIETIANEFAVAPAEQELSEFERFGAEFATAKGAPPDAAE